MNILFVCTGNTCRSPIAEAISRKIIKDNPDKFGFIKVASAGIMAEDGAKMSENASIVLKNHNAMYEEFVSKNVYEELLESADLVLTMGQSHKMVLASVNKQWADKIFTIGEYIGDNQEISDPFGGDIEDYEACFKDLEEKITIIFNKLV